MKSTLADRTYTLLRQVPAGRVTTYKALANALGTKSYRAIGQIMRRNPFAPVVPCHRVVASNGSLGGFKGKRNGAEIQEKITLLTHEGVVIDNLRVQNFSNRLFTTFIL